jgi:hypothetical protein
MITSSFSSVNVLLKKFSLSGLPQLPESSVSKKSTVNGAYFFSQVIVYGVLLLK